jgi:hypothetical protein
MKSEDFEKKLKVAKRGGLVPTNVGGNDDNNNLAKLKSVIDNWDQIMVHCKKAIVDIWEELVFIALKHPLFMKEVARTILTATATPSFGSMINSER